MPKKSRRSKAKHRTRAAKATQEQHLQQPEPLTAELQSSTGVSTKAQDFTNRYQYVIPEVKRIGIIAGAIILVLVILSFTLG
jgi:hypothetical protein